MDSVLLHREVGRAKDLSTALRKRIMVCLCSIRVLINKIEVGPQNSEFECWLYQGFFIPDCCTYHVVLSLILAILALVMKLAGLGTAPVRNGDVQYRPMWCSLTVLYECRWTSSPV